MWTSGSRRLPAWMSGRKRRLFVDMRGMLLSSSDDDLDDESDGWDLSGSNPDDDLYDPVLDGFED
jgi:hypothetical protein